MLRALLRLFISLGGAAATVVLVALYEARVVASAVVESGERELPPFGSLVLAELGLLSPMAVGIGAAVGVLLLLLQPGEVSSPGRWLDSVRSGEPLERLRAATVAPSVVLVAFGWCLTSAHVARVAMSAAKPAEAGLSAALGSVLSLVVWLALALACAPALRRTLARRSVSVPRLLDPAVTGGAALAVVALLFALGIALGDTSGAGGGVLGVFGIFKRTELDLRPVAVAAVIAAGAFVAPVLVARAYPRDGASGIGSTDFRARIDPRAVLVAAGAVVLHVLLLVLCVVASSSVGEPAVVARGIEKHAPLGKIALAVLRRVADHDHDGFSASFAGGDCNDRDKGINPNALDVPGNGIDEDCSGADTPLADPTPVVAAKAEPASAKPKRSFNVILLTVDTLRPDLGFMNYGKPTSPNLDKVAEKGTVFERGYSMASYTGKAVGPMLIGRYPSETNTDFSHFNTYFDSNVFVAERARDAGIRTFAGMCHWYFRNPTGLKQGFDVWDTSAIPPGMGDNDNVVTSERMADLALKLLQRPDNTLGSSADELDAGAPGEVDSGSAPPAGEASAKPHRFFAWFHFFDPHAQYVAHEGAPDVTSKGAFGSSRTLYDQEVWYTDKHIGRVLDYVAAQPWAEDTAIVMTADHGEAFYEHGMMFHGSEIWEELVHVPLFVYVPGAEPRRVTQKRSHIDVVPTILELLGIPLPADDSLRGHSLLDDVYLPKGDEHAERDVYVDMPQGPFNGVRRALISGPSPGTKLIHSGGLNYQLFDLATDPDEKKDLASDKEKREAAIARMSAMRGRLKEVEVKPR